MFKNNNFGNTSNSVVKKLAPLYQLIIGNSKNLDVALAEGGITIVLEAQKLYEHSKNKEIYHASEKVINLLWEF